MLFKYSSTNIIQRIRLQKKLEMELEYRAQATSILLLRAEALSKTKDGISS